MRIRSFCCRQLDESKVSSYRYGLTTRKLQLVKPNKQYCIRTLNRSQLSSRSSIDAINQCATSKLESLRLLYEIYFLT
ncbi:unnamed protein product [Schistosoma spindalis]|nr:unnamed protein product [Schistosoma spindale]